MTLAKFLTVICMASFVSGCQWGLADGAARFSDVSKAPPKAKPATIRALGDDRAFAEWVIYQDKLCDLHGCV